MPVSLRRHLVVFRGGTWWLGLGLAVGAAGGLAAVAFRELIFAITWITTGWTEFGVQGRVASGHAAVLGIAFLVIAPILGGLVYGPLISRYASEARGHGVPEVMLAVRRHGGVIRPRIALVKALASAVCIGTGGSVGREGPIVQIGSALGSSVGQLLRLPADRMRLLVACGAAAGISATFNAPIAAVFFTVELILGELEIESFGSVVLASVVAAVIGRAAFGDTPFLGLPPFHQRSVWEYGWYAALGLGAVVVGLAFTRLLYGLEDLGDAVWRGPEWLRPAVGGVLLGGLLLAVPQVYGVGYPVMQHALAGRYALGFVLLLLLAKILATSTTMAIGGSGGVFAPSLFMGAMLGAATGQLANGLTPGVAAPAGAYGLVGMAAVFAAASRAPITAIVIVFELTGDYTIILPLMTAVAVAVAGSSLASEDTIYTLKLRRRGIPLKRSHGSALADITVAEAMTAEPLVDHPLPVHVGGDQGEDLTAAPRIAAATAHAATPSTTQPLPVLSTNDSLEHALHLLARDETGELPVLDDEGLFVGWLGRAQLLTAYSARLQPDV
ncbi:MAG TPA: chloride channel protein [Gaiellales bacterium]|nr:chloride channel protein [Gaiellales bacterium]